MAIVAEEMETIYNLVRIEEEPDFKRLDMMFADSILAKSLSISCDSAGLSFFRL